MSRSRRPSGGSARGMRHHTSHIIPNPSARRRSSGITMPRAGGAAAPRGAAALGRAPAAHLRSGPAHLSGLRRRDADPRVPHRARGSEVGAQGVLPGSARRYAPCTPVPAGAVWRARHRPFPSPRGRATRPASVLGERARCHRSFALRSTEEFEKSDGFRRGTDHRISGGRVAATGPLVGGRLSSNIAVGSRDFGANDFYGPYNSTERTQSATADTEFEVPLARWLMSVGGSTRRHTDRFTLVRDNPQIYENFHKTWRSTGELTARTSTHGAPPASPS